MALKEKADAYFASINPMARRMCVDLKETKLSYENLWQTLSHEEQDQILNQSIIKPEISVRYPAQENNNANNLQFAIKMIVDDNYTYRDEHSAPFSFRTNSQRDLTVFGKRHSPKQIGHKVVAAKVPTQVIPSPRNVELPEDNIDCIDEMDTDSLTLILPKTGLDLLDNW